MVTIIATFLLLSGILATAGQARNNYESIKSISYYILSLGALALSMDYFNTGESANALLPIVFIAVVSLHFFLGEVSKNKTRLIRAAVRIHFSFCFDPIGQLGLLSAPKTKTKQMKNNNKAETQ